MKKVNLLFALLLWAVGASAQDTVHVTSCATFWKDGNPVTETNLRVQFVNPSFPVPPMIFLGDTSQACVTAAIPTSGIPPATQVYVGPQKDIDHLNGVTMLDVEAIAKHILGLEPLPSPYAMIAADVNKSGSITSFDLVEIRKLILGIYPKFPSNESWRFVDNRHVFPDPNNPFKTAFPESYLESTIANFDGDTLSFIGIKVGDVDGDAQKKGKKYTGPVTTDSMAVSMPDTLLPGGLNEVLVPVYVLAPIYSVRMLQLEFQHTHPSVKIVGMASGTVPMTNEDNYFVSANGGGRVAIIGPGSSYNLNIGKDKPAFYLRLRVESLEPILLKNALAINPSAMPCFSSARQTNGTYKSYRLVQHFGSTSSLFSPAANTLRTTPATPNPFTDKALVQIELTETTSVLLEVFGLDGRLRWSEEQRLPAGLQALEIPAEAVEQGGMALYRVRAGSGVATGKVARLD